LKTTLPRATPEEQLQDEREKLKMKLRKRKRKMERQSLKRTTRSTVSKRE